MALKGTLYGITKTKSDIDGKEQFKSMIKEVNESGVVVIDGRNIAAGSIFANQISADAITAKQIKSDSITADHISAAGITANKIKSGSLTATNGKSTINLDDGTFDFGKGKFVYNGVNMSMNVDTLTIGGLVGATENKATEIANNAISGIEVGGRNWISKATAKVGYLESTGKINTNTGWRYTDYIPVKPNEKYIARGYSNLGSSPSVVFFNSSKVYVSGINNGGVNRGANITIPVGVSFMVFSFEWKDFGSIKLEKGTIATDWTPAIEDVDETTNSLRQDLTKAQNDVISAQSSATSANNLIGDMSSDSKLTAIEKKNIKKEWDIIVGEKPKIESNANVYNINSIEKTNYIGSYNSLSSYLSPILLDLNSTSNIVGIDFRNMFKNYYNSRQDLLNKISNESKLLSSKAQEDIDNLQIGGRNYVVDSNFSNESLGKWFNNGSVVYQKLDNKNVAKLGNASGIYNYLTTPPEGIYTISFIAKSDTLGNSAKVGFLNSGIGASKVFSLSNKWVKYSFTTAISIDGEETLFHIYSTGSPYYITDIKVEKGNKVTDWTPAPEDTTSDILKAKENAISDSKKAADAVAKAEAELAETRANSYSDGKISLEEKRAIKEASDKLKEAQDYAVVKNEEMKKYIQSRGENLITNGTGLLGNNENFSQFVFDASDTYGTSGSFTYTGGSTTRFADEFVPVDINASYKFSYAIKTTPYLESRAYGMVVCYDSDNLQIGPHQTMYTKGSLTKLTKPLKNGDTVMYLENASKWYNSGTSGVSTHYRTVILWNYKNSSGYQYLPETYSRNSYANAWEPGAVNTVDNTITLREPWKYGDVALGTELSCGSSGGSYKYIAGANFLIPENWEVISGNISGIDTSGTNVANRFHPGTASVKIGWLLNRYQTTKTWITALNFSIDYNSGIEEAKESARLAQDSANSAAGSASTANSLLEDLSSDSKITAVEKKNVKKEWDIIVGEKPKIESSADLYSITSEKLKYTNAYNVLSGYISPLISNLSTTSNISGATFRNNFKTYYDTRQDLLNAISSKSKQLSDSAQSTVDNLEIGGSNLLPATKELLYNSGASNNTSDYYNGLRIAEATAAATGYKDIVSLNTPALDSLEYTLSFYAKSTKTNQNIICHFYSPNTTISAVSSTGQTSVVSDGGINVTLSTSWKRYWVTWKQSSAGAAKAIIVGRITGSGSQASISGVKFEKGNKASDWSPAPEDSYLKTHVPIRFIRDWANGNTTNANNHWYEIQAYSKGENVALGKTVTSSGSTLSNGLALTDGLTASSFYTSTGVGKNYVQIDLGSVYRDIDEVKVWRYHDGGRTYKETKTEVSENGIDWLPIFDSLIEGEYPEIATGRSFETTKARIESLVNAAPSASLVQNWVTKGQVTIRGGALEADSVTAGSIKANTITSNEILAGSITADRIKANSITSSQIEAGSLTADDIKAGTLESKNGVTKINMTTGDFNFGSGKVVLAGNNLSLNVDSLKITNKNVATQEEVSKKTDQIENFTGGGKIYRSPASDSRNPLKGALIIKTPITSPYMTKISITGYNYASTNQTNIDLDISFYAYTNNSFVNTSYVNKGNFPIDSVRLGRDAAGCSVIIIGSETTSWSYPKIQIKEAIVSHSTPPASFDNGWSITYTTTLASITSVVNVLGSDFDSSINTVKNLTDGWKFENTTEINGGLIRTNTITASQIAAKTITAAQIATGSLVADDIKTGMLQSKNGVSKINMDTGDFSFGEGKIALAGNNLTLNVDKLTIGISKTPVATSDEIKERIEKIDIGGRNLILNSDGSISSNKVIVPKVESISITPTAMNIKENEVLTLTATLLPEGSSSIVNWSTNNPNVSIVGLGNSCTVTGLKAGSSTVTASVESNPLLTAYSVVTITPPIVPVSSINVTPLSKTIKPGESVTLNASLLPVSSDANITWTVSNGNVKIVSSNKSCVVTGQLNGDSVITASVDGYSSLSKTVAIKVVTPVESISVVPTTKTIKKADTFTLTAALAPVGSVSGVNWTSSNANVSIIGSGNTCAVTGVKDGSSIITATVADNPLLTSTSVIKVEPDAPVIPPVASITVSPTTKIIEVDEVFTVTASMLPLEASSKITWSTNNANVKIVDLGNNCTVTGLAKGTAIVTATVADKPTLKATTTITVNDKPPIIPAVTSIIMGVTDVKIGAEASIGATLMPANSKGVINFTTNNANITLRRLNDTSTYITGVTAGTTIVTATLEGNPEIKSSTTVTVQPPDVTSITVSPTASVTAEVESTLFVGLLPAYSVGTVSFKASNDNLTLRVRGEKSTYYTGKKNGTTIITATLDGNPSITASITITITGAAPPTPDLVFHPSSSNTWSKVGNGQYFDGTNNLRSSSDNNTMTSSQTIDITGYKEMVINYRTKTSGVPTYVPPSIGLSDVNSTRIWQIKYKTDLKLFSGVSLYSGLATIDLTGIPNGRYYVVWGNSDFNGNIVDVYLDSVGFNLSTGAAREMSMFSMPFARTMALEEEQYSYELSKELEIGKQYTIKAEGLIENSKISVSVGGSHQGEMVNGLLTFTSNIGTAKNLLVNPTTQGVVIDRIKLEQGNKPSSWDRAPEDVQTEMSGYLDTKADRNIFEFSMKELADAKSQAENALSSDTYNEFLAGYEDYRSAVAEDQIAASNALQAVLDTVVSIENNMGETSEKWKFIDTSITNAEGGIKISSEASAMSVLIGPDRISFFDNLTEVAFISDKVLQINHGVFLMSVQVGAHLISSLPEDNDITVVQWVGIKKKK